MNKFIGLVLASMIFSSFSQGTKASEEVTCAIMVKAGKGVEAIPPQGKVLTRFKDSHPLACGSMVITHNESAWVRLSSQVNIKIAPNSFIELAKSKEDSHKLYRGNMLVDAPIGTANQVVMTPNGKMVLHGGVVWMEYRSEEKLTSVGSFVAQCKFQNRYHDQAVQTVHAGEISHLAIDNSRIIPSQPELMQTGSVEKLLTQFDVTKDDRDQYLFSIDKSYESKLRSFTAELENWGQKKDEPSRDIASVSGKPSFKDAIDDKEAQHTLKILKERLYGEAADLKKLDEEESSVRAPASVVTAPVAENKKLQDTVYEQTKKKNAKEGRRLIDEISRLPVDE